MHFRPKVDANNAALFMTDGVDWGCGTACDTPANCITACNTDRCNKAKAAHTCHGYTKAATDGAMWTKDDDKVTCYEDTAETLVGCKM